MLPNKAYGVSAHPDVILKMGPREVLYRTQHLGWGTDTWLYSNPDELLAGLSLLLKSGPRVLKQLLLQRFHVPNLVDMSYKIFPLPHAHNQIIQTINI
jgi:hypothetical protein